MSARARREEFTKISTEERNQNAQMRQYGKLLKCSHQQPAPTPACSSYGSNAALESGFKNFLVATCCETRFTPPTPPLPTVTTFTVLLGPCLLSSCLSPLPYTHQTRTTAQECKQYEEPPKRQSVGAPPAALRAGLELNWCNKYRYVCVYGCL